MMILMREKQNLELNKKVKPERGKAVLFFNLNDDNKTYKEKNSTCWITT